MSVLGHRARILTGWLSLVMWAVAVHAQTPGARDERSFSVTHYDVQLEPRLESRTVTGTVTLLVVVHRDDVETIALNRGRLEIDGVLEDGRARAFVVDGNHELRELLGDTTFWGSIRRYTTEHFGRSVTTKDFRAAMEQASSRDLRAFFDRWVYQ